MQKLSQVDFFKACDFIRSNQDRLAKLERPSLLQAVEEEAGVRITRHHLQRIQEATGVEWLIDNRKRREIRQSEAVRILAISLAELRGQVGLRIPDDLAQLAAEGFTLEGGGE